MNDNYSEFTAFEKMPRYSRDCLITEKIDGTNAQISIDEYGVMRIGSRQRWITPESDNFGFARWAVANKDELLKLGVGRHFGEWWGSGIQRSYGMKEKVFSLFNAGRWVEQGKPVGEKQETAPACCRVVPILFQGPFTTQNIQDTLTVLTIKGSAAAPGFMNPEGIIIFHIPGQVAFKKTIRDDEVPKSLAK